MSVSTVEIESASIESLLVTFATTFDPTALDVEFMITDQSVKTPSGTWIPGSWETDYENCAIKALTPTIGATGATIVVAQDDRLRLWSRVNLIVDLCARILVK